MRRKRLSKEQYLSGIIAADRIVLSQAITLIESTHPEDEQLAAELMEMLPANENSTICRKIGITGVPGVGKSTFIDAFGSYLTAGGNRIAILSIDPTSRRTGGSILGDKTRMENLATDRNAYIRPSPSGNTLGGVAHKTRETILLCQAAGFDYILVETVGVGQSEVLVKDMVDYFLLLMLAGGGDELQGIKRGIMEMADLLIINKADGDNLKAARKAKSSYKNALHFFPPNENGWIPDVMLCSALEKTGLAEILENISRFYHLTISNGHLEENRAEQRRQWFTELLQHKMLRKLYRSPEISDQILEIQKKVAQNQVNVPAAVHSILLKE